MTEALGYVPEGRVYVETDGLNRVVRIEPVDISLGQDYYTAKAGNVGRVYEPVAPAKGNNPTFKDVTMKVDGEIASNPSVFPRFGTSTFDLYRKVTNTGEFKYLNEPMQLRHIDRVTKRAGIGLNGIRVRIIREPSMIGRGYFGYTFPDGKTIHLYPDAFSDAETLVKTLAHERTHVYQVVMFGPAKDSQTLSIYEQAARENENIWWEYFQKGGN